MSKLSCVLAVVIACLVFTTDTWAANRHKISKTARRFLISNPSNHASSSVSPGLGGAWPSVFNLATKARIEANGTCGENGREEFCRDQSLARSRSAHCGVCDAHSPDPNKRHPVQYAIDGNNNHWWQSPSLAEGEDFQYISVTLDLGQVYEVAYVIVRAGPSSRPATWVLERSIDSLEDWIPWQFFARTPSECQDVHNLPAVMGKPKPLAGPNATCTAFYSKVQPPENGEIHISLLSDSSGDWSRGRYVRLRLLGSHSTGRADRRYYTIRDVTIGGRCACSGHAQNCRHNVARGHPECECIHHTCGPNCDHCCPLYNQLPFAPGSNTEANVCQPCQCYGHATECVFDAEVNVLSTSIDTHGRYKGGGVCVNCQKHTTGINCEKCDFGYYRPPEVLPDDEMPCHKCECDFYGSTGNCKFDDFDLGIECECKDGFTGLKCDQCSAGYKGYPECQLCPCNRAGTIITTDCSGICFCKSNVEGQFCDTCREGYFSLDANNPDGCVPCYCSGVSTVCQSTYIENHVFQTLLEWMVTDMSVTNSVVPTLDTDTGWLTIGNYELPGIESYYWNAPDLYLGNKLKAYGSRLIFRLGWVVMRGDTSGKPTTGPNVIIIGQNGMKIAFDDISYPQIGDEIEIIVPLRENFWYHIPPTVRDIVTRLRRTEYKGELVSRSQFMSVLSNIKHVLLRAKFHTDQVEGSLEEVLILLGDGKAQMSASSVEKCSCPSGYTGLSCELCAFGYVRIFTNTSTHIQQFECVKCDCNGHAETCDLSVGKCGACEHNTAGEKCERCVSGHYGNPLTGNRNDCKRCACPLLEDSNNFSPSCALDGNNGDKYFCTQCPEGYTGDHCEICDYGFFGDPTILGSKCEICSCNGAPCDNVTGQCLSCPGNTQGFKCDSCKEDHYGIASEKDCKPCDCDIVGSESSTCDINTGQCRCKERFTGRACITCKEGFGNVTAGCLPCSCSGLGSATRVCDPVSGYCDCLPGVEGFHCDDCQYLHYGFSAQGCKDSRLYKCINTCLGIQRCGQMGIPVRRTRSQSGRNSPCPGRKRCEREPVGCSVRSSHYSSRHRPSQQPPAGDPHPNKFPETSEIPFIS